MPSRFKLASENHRFLIERYALSSCLNCRHFDAKQEKCQPADQRPPAEVLVYGCSEWDDVPF